MSTLVRYAVDGPVARLTLDSPHNRNALSAELVEQLHQRLTDAVADPEVRAVVLDHTGGTFCAGADLGQAAGGDAEQALRANAVQMARLLRRILELRVPVIAAVDGHARAGGLGLIGACDIVVAGPASTFALTEVRIGVAPSIISLTLLPKITARAAGRYFVTGERFGPAEAVQMGLVTVAADDVDAAVAALTDAIAKGSPQGLAAAKALTTASILRGFDEHADELARQTVELFSSAEAREGMRAFLEKRPPRWQHL
ncbi:MAG: enoyl-CoA hydratase family protein [Mycolicibacterium hassiacum]|jgi:enoyl-CoA hydratase|uniref:enoyl-CoA hydratase family protein n=1 Tax=Mycolicibacterium hassiacum TaxID=46351 RepID=UPI000DB5F697|nr:enoyl-CoA hydratase family protein [Mycolicibacterium hassiacum]MBX5487793.1 enoyl-CoA hydratase family protein [Mycolicibacterium hassiacum]PZN21211.1 MAG: enoyl-CoA hydratase family protein [Mycolicibacterium hassiacum]